MQAAFKQNRTDLHNELVALDQAHFLHPTSSLKQLQDDGPSLIFTEGDGIFLKDITGRTFIDSLSSLWNVNIGHGRKEPGKAAAEQMGKLAFSSTFSNWSHEPVIRLAAKIASMTPGDLNTTFFTSGGSEANDTAFKTVRHYWKLKGRPEKRKIASRKKSYHGVAMGSTSATGIQPFHDFTTSMASDFYHVGNTVQAFQDFIDQEGADTIGAFIAEPVQGSGGVNLPPEGYFQEIREICDRHDILLISDEVITGFGRTGKMFGMDHYDVVPDMMVIAKGITSGYAPLGGMVITDRLYQELTDLAEGNFMHGYTYSGHPVGCVVAMENLEIIERENLVEHVHEMGLELLKGFKWLQDQHTCIKSYRGLGLLGAISLDSGIEGETLAPKVVAEALKRGMVGRAIVYHGQDTLAFAPPFVITKEQIQDMITIVHESLLAAK
ncbi:Putrescine--pyruvate transaminase [Lentibacillus sp. JNUCC-1]|uniref:aminotransferase family protein n=1 Tax=Lentibacillus sp. JNUCC-1 TaxID=2654513 RepID=UPI0012E8A19D|nr:aspartate aminotransferase family protein [Lentibacillus sp. JNUCC-1]MUV37447.1 Putrescine--pyruvate transaminase [Lentibacillus sp. JNUCC-1]